MMEFAVGLVRRINAQALMLLHGRRIGHARLKRLRVVKKVIIVLPNRKLVPYYRRCGIPVIVADDRRLTRFARIKHALIAALSRRLLTRNDRVICLTGPAGKHVLDSITSVAMDRDIQKLIGLMTYAKKSGIPLNVIESLVDLSIELGAYGREGKPIGTILVVGDIGKVMGLSRQLFLNPFRGHEDKEKSVLDPEVRETLKEFAKVDGAILVRHDGVVSAAGRLLLLPQGEVSIMRGYGSRHNAAAFITGHTLAVALVVSSTAGTISVFVRGKLWMTFRPNPSVSEL